MVMLASFLALWITITALVKCSVNVVQLIPSLRKLLPDDAQPVWSDFSMLRTCCFVAQNCKSTSVPGNRLELKRRLGTGFVVGGAVAT